MENKSKFDAQLNRMMYLNEYKTTKVVPVKSNKIEFYKESSDGKVYGILKEGNLYYIMKTEKGKELIPESYQYLNGFNYRMENAYKSYNEASKMLELKLININESMGVHEDVSVIDYDKNKKALKTLTEEARTELNRMQQIIENSKTIGFYNNVDKKMNKQTIDVIDKGEPFNNGTENTPTKDACDVKDVEQDLTCIKDKELKNCEMKKTSQKQEKEKFVDIVSESENNLVGFEDDETEEDIEDKENEDNDEPIGEPKVEKNITFTDDDWKKILKDLEDGEDDDYSDDLFMEEENVDVDDETEEEVDDEAEFEVDLDKQKPKIEKNITFTDDDWKKILRDLEDEEDDDYSDDLFMEEDNLTQEDCDEVFNKESNMLESKIERISNIVMENIMSCKKKKCKTLDEVIDSVIEKKLKKA